jgi:hypothetical protein
VTRAEAARETPVLPGAIDVVGRIVSAGIVPDPAAALGMDVRRVRMSGLVAKIALRGFARLVERMPERSRSEEQPELR